MGHSCGAEVAFLCLVTRPCKGWSTILERAFVCSVIASGPSLLELFSFVGILDVDVLEKQAVTPSTSLLNHELEVVFCTSSATVFALKAIMTPFYEVSTYFRNISVVFCDRVNALFAF